MGELIAWIIGWDLLFEYGLAATTVAIGWSGYVVSFVKDFGITVPDVFSAAPFDFDPARGEWKRTAALINAPAMAAVVLASMLLVVGIHESAKVNNIIVVIKVGIVVIFIFASIWFVNAANWVTASIRMAR
jgi:APA family basic amino acid/polyamine antiporter